MTRLVCFIKLIVAALGVEPRNERLPLQSEDVEGTYANGLRARRIIGFQPTTKIEEGIPSYVEWRKQLIRKLHFTRCY